MKHDRSEKFSEEIFNIDDDLLTLACEIDSAEKLHAHLRKHKAIRPIAHKYALIAACLALAIGITGALPFLQRIIDPTPIETETPFDTDITTETVTPFETETPPVTDTPENPSGEDGIKIEKIDGIDSMDMVNYYSALKILTDSDPMIAAKFSFEISQYEDFLNLSTSKNGTSDVHYYKFNRNSFFSISQGTFFQIEVTEENNVLASLVGTGIVDVAITHNSIDPMITFRNEDRYFSCLRNGEGSGLIDGIRYIEFSTSKQTDGFYITKKASGPIYSFLLIYDDNGAIREFYCFPEGQADQHDPEGPVAVAGKTYTIRKDDKISIDDLEQYFSTDKYLK